MKKENKTVQEFSPAPPVKPSKPDPYREIAHYKNQVFSFDFQACLAWMEKQGRILFGKHFRIYPDDRELIRSLLVYAIGDNFEAGKANLDTGKGILLTGPIGCGKTSLMTLINYFFPKPKQYEVKSAREISFTFEKEGFDIIRRFGGDFHHSQSNSGKVYCFDDLGVEMPMKYFGNQCNVMAEIILSRYDLFMTKRIPTHLTTNLSASEMENRYGNRVRSRMREMFNLVAFDKNAKDKRR